MGWVGVRCSQAGLWRTTPPVVWSGPAWPSPAALGRTPTPCLAASKQGQHLPRRALAPDSLEVCCQGNGALSDKLVPSLSKGASTSFAPENRAGPAPMLRGVSPPLLISKIWMWQKNTGRCRDCPQASSFLSHPESQG